MWCVGEESIKASNTSKIEDQCEKREKKRINNGKRPASNATETKTGTTSNTYSSRAPTVLASRAPSTPRLRLEGRARMLLAEDAPGRESATEVAVMADWRVVQMPEPLRMARGRVTCAKERG